MPGVGSNQPSDSQLLADVAAKDRMALSTLYDRHAPTFLAAALRIVGNQAEAEDVLQEAILLIWDKAATYRSESGAPFSWMITLLRNKALERLRSNRRRDLLPSQKVANTESPNQSSPGAFAESNETNSRLRSAVLALPDEQRQAIELAYYDAMTQTQIAASLNEPLGTIKTRIRRGLMKLRDVLDGVL